MDRNEIYNLIDRFEFSGLTEMELELPGVKLALKKGTGEANSAERRIPNETGGEAVMAVENHTHKDNCTEVKAPLVGTFYRAPSPEEPPFAEVGKPVKKGDVIGIIEAMKLMNEVTATADGIVTAIEVEDGVMVEYGETLVKIGKQ